MEITAEQVEGLRRRVQALNDRRAEAEAQQRVAAQELARLELEARDEFGAVGLPELEAMLAAEEEALAQRVVALDAALREAEAASAALPS